MKNEKTTVVSIGNQKGGVGKTTTTLNLAAALGQLGKEVLVIDLDQNCGATRGLGIPPESYASSFDMMVGEGGGTGAELDPLELVITTDPDEDLLLPEGVSMITGNRSLEDLDDVLRKKPEARFSMPGAVLEPSIQKLVDAKKWDFIFLDTAPQLTTATLGAYRVAEWFIVVTQPEALSILGMEDAFSDLKLVRKEYNPALKLLGVVIGNYAKGTKTAMTLDRQIRDQFEGTGTFGPFKQNISRTVAIPTAQYEQMTIIQHKPAHQSTEEFRCLAKEVMERINLGAPPATGGGDEAEKGGAVAGGGEARTHPEEVTDAG
ncbi:ParA family protein [Phycisphaera mikurensis]|uniref:Putative chromosome partitioning protein ParA n=1 Tax=Phycisphaera mikurensis (strain NBRC 102666 / KCTC 22515 / FYK2301M01) TaxID=1142394 RepID=I0IJK1_PHYMF|nr:ParA family protein [Phycisphaera mikurensis]MBB6443188.1 chromosome partitioning protein [Phycisphaera mikurensis]BAM05439.1 putative chromosome partitioning protein ParA [Phycisphaera mikurensis NBRC 102666]